MTVFDGVNQRADVQNALTELKIASALGENVKALYAKALTVGATVQEIEEAIS